MKTLITIFALSFAFANAHASVVSVPGLHGLNDSHHFKLSSEQTGHNYHLVVGLPRDYDSSQTYPTVYILDGGALYPMLKSYSVYLQHAGDMPPAILVAVSYGTDDWQQGNQRSSDYTAPSAERDYWGGAQKFQAFLEQDVMPLVESKFASDPDKRILFGQSIGGQFVLYSAQTKPMLFWGHIASNAALHRNLPFFLETVPKSSKGQSNLFVASAEFDDKVFREPLLAWMKHWSDVASLPWQLKTVTLKGHNHFSAPPASFRQGMIWLFR